MECFLCGRGADTVQMEQEQKIISSTISNEYYDSSIRIPSQNINMSQITISNVQQFIAINPIHKDEQDEWTD
jgi:hypothetical protein